MRHFFLLLIALGLLAAQPAAAQKTLQDPRPLQGLDRDRIPTYPSVQAFLQAHPPAGLRSAATVAGRAGLSTMPATAGRALRAAGLRPNAAARLGSLRIVRASNGTVRWMQGTLGQVEGLPGAGKTEQAVPAVLRALAPYAGVMGLQEPSEELRLMRADRDDLGYVHVRFQQVYDGLPVWGRDLYVHVDARGVVYAVNGTYEPTPAGLVTRPALSAGAALQTVVDDLRDRQRWAPLPDDAARWLGIAGPVTTLVLYPDEQRGMRPAYEVSLHPNLLEWYIYLVDAQTGRILNRIARHCTLFPDAAPPAPARSVTLPLSGPAAPGVIGTFFDAAATDLNGRAQNLRVYQHDDGIFYELWDLDNLNQAQSQLPDNPMGGALTISANSTDLGENVQLTHVTSNNNTWNDPASVSAHVNMRIAYDYYRDTHNRNAIDGKDQSIISIIHVTDGSQPMDNAFWNGRVMAYGDGQQFFKPLAGGLDVAAHEMTHGVIQNTADLLYQFQSGALNESFADVFGAMVDRDDFLMGEDIMQQNLALRDLLNPGNPQVLSQQPAHMSQFRNLGADQDNGGVHVNSGIPNRAAALVIQSLGHAQAERIYYRALTTYLTRNSQFGDARNALEQAARDLSGAGSPAETAVQQAFDAVGITGTSGTGGDGGNDLPPQTGGQSLLTFMIDDGSIGLLDLEDPGNPGLFVDPRAAARVDATTGDRAQLTTPLSGERIWFINQQNRLAFVELQSGQVSIFSNLFLQQQGDLWNASISPDENYVALVSAYANDPTLYIYDGQDIGAIPLTPETTQDGIEDQSIQYPDVVAWSPNPQLPRIAFDAFNQVPFGLSGGSISYWSMYEINFAAGTIFNLIPAQPAELSVGNVTYASTDPDLIGFNVLDASGTWDVLVGNFATGEIAALDIPSFTLNGTPITDAQRPTFAPDDTQLAFSSPAFGVLLFFDFASGGLSFIDLGAAVYNPRWFLAGGSGGSQNRAPTAAFSATALSGTAPLLVGVDASASSDPDGDPLVYRWDFGDGSIGSGPTAVHTYAFAGTFTLTLTVTDAGGQSGTQARQVDVAGTGVSVEDDDALPRAVALHPNYPNPFNPATLLRFDLPAPAEVELTILDVLGRTVATLVRGPEAAGTHEARFDASALPSGVYTARLRAGTVVRTRTLVLLR